LTSRQFRAASVDLIQLVEYNQRVKLILPPVTDGEEKHRHGHHPKEAVMATISVIWDDDNEPGGNVQHLAEHGVTKEEVEEVLDDHYADYFLSQEEPHNPITFGDTTTGKYIAVVFEVVESDPPTIYPITAYEAPRPGPRKKGKRKR
jgi:hypothetical protein